MKELEGDSSFFKSLKLKQLRMSSNLNLIYKQRTQGSQKSRVSGKPTIVREVNIDQVEPGKPRKF